jgi:hypothetical protein
MSPHFVTVCCHSITWHISSQAPPHIRIGSSNSFREKIFSWIIPSSGLLRRVSRFHTEISGLISIPSARVFLDILILEDGTDRWSRNVDFKPSHARVTTEMAEDLISTAAEVLRLRVNFNCSKIYKSVCIVNGVLLKQQRATRIKNVCDNLTVSYLVKKLPSFVETEGILRCGRWNPPSRRPIKMDRVK